MSVAAVDLTFCWYFILKSNFPLKCYFNAELFDNTFLYYTVFSLINIITVYLRFSCLFTSTFHGRVPVSPLIPYNIKFVQRGFTERAAFEERISHVGRGFTVIHGVAHSVSRFLTLKRNSEQMTISSAQKFPQCYRSTWITANYNWYNSRIYRAALSH
jgi:hypothetical protein